MRTPISNTRVTIGLLLLMLLASIVPALDARADGMNSEIVPPYTTPPVFYDLFWDLYAPMENLELVHEGKVKLGKLGIHSIENFDWNVRGKQSRSFWVYMENFWYLTPLIQSTAERDRVFVRRWLEGWLDAHAGKPWNQPGARDAMSAGFRAMTFVWYLRELHDRGETDSAWTARIRDAVEEHQKFLRDHFNPVSNHGYWEAMGLFETTRVCPDTSVVRLALHRLDEMVADGISEHGLSIERSPMYQFEVWRWITQYTEYFHAMAGFEWDGLAALDAVQQKISRANYYLVDHGGNVPQIGDTDAQKFDAEPVPDAPEVLVDEQAGYAFYKDADVAHGRYVVFTVPSLEHPNNLPYHNHNDALSVYYSHRGEIILGDSGRYSYQPIEPGPFFRSAAAHNVVRRASGLTQLREARVHELQAGSGSGSVEFAATLEGDHVSRVVRVPENGVALEVRDSISDDAAYVVLWHMGPDVESIVQVDAGTRPTDATEGRSVFHFELTSSGQRRFLLAISTDARPPAMQKAVEIVSGRERPTQGWYSREEGKKVPAPVIVINVDVRGRAFVAMTIEPTDR